MSLIHSSQKRTLISFVRYVSIWGFLANLVYGFKELYCPHHRMHLLDNSLFSVNLRTISDFAASRICEFRRLKFRRSHQKLRLKGGGGGSSSPQVTSSEFELLLRSPQGPDVLPNLIGAPEIRCKKRPMSDIRSETDERGFEPFRAIHTQSLPLWEKLDVSRLTPPAFLSFLSCLKLGQTNALGHAALSPFFRVRHDLSHARRPIPPR